MTPHPCAPLSYCLQSFTGTGSPPDVNQAWCGEKTVNGLGFRGLTHMSRNDSCNSQHTLDQQSPQTPVHASCLESKAHPPNISAHVDTAPLRPQSSNLMRSWWCIPVPAQTTIAHLVPVMRSISAHAPHPVLIMCASRTTSAYPQLQASSWPPSSYSPSRPTHLFHMLHMQDGSQLLAVCPCMWLTPW